MQSTKFSRRLSIRFLTGFPWLAGISTYTVSWGWSLIRPNTLFWDDWTYVFSRPPNYISEIFTKTGLPPWRALIDKELLGVGYWTIRWLTFIMFFVAGLFLFEILKQISFLTAIQRKSIVLLFLILPLNHARISLTMFGYTTSYFLFFLSWLLLVRRQNWISVFISCFCLSWCYMTHSFLIFSALPIIHFCCIHRHRIFRRKPNFGAVAQVGLLLGMPIAYYALRSTYWPPDDEYLWYHTIYFRGVLVSMVYFLPFIFSIGRVIIRLRRGMTITPNALITTFGFLALSVGLCPYIISGNLDSRMIFFFWELDWTSRHQLLMPLGASLLLLAGIDVATKQLADVILALVVVVAIALNIVWGMSTYVDSLKKERLVHLLSLKLPSDQSSNYVFIDKTTRFNFRGSVYRRYEFEALLSKTGISNPVVMDECGELPKQVEIIVKSKKTFVEGFISRDLGLTVEVTPCVSG